MPENTPITVARGDGIGPEIMDATLHILKEAGARLAIEEIEIGEKVYLRGISAGIEPSSIESLLRTKVFLKAPITTPQGGGFKSLNVTTRKMLGLYANVRPCVSYYPYVDTKHPKMDVVIVRENEEDLYAGIEYNHTPDLTQAVKIISRSGTERIVRYAFEYAIRNNRKKVTCFMKDNIMKVTDGLFHRVFDEIGALYPAIEKEAWIVDIGAAKMADTPENFDVIVMPNLYGDILSDVAAQIAGSVGLAGSANIGMKYAMFEAIHGSAPRRANQNLANPSGLLLGAVLMLVHIDQPDVAARVHNAWLRTLEEGIHTYDIYDEGKSARKVGTKEFAQAVGANVGKLPEKLKVVAYNAAPKQRQDQQALINPLASARRELKGVDVSVYHAPGDPAAVGKRAETLGGDIFDLVLISSRGAKVYPGGLAEAITGDDWRCRYEGKAGATVKHEDVIALLGRVQAAGLEFTQTQLLFHYDGKPGYTMSQGQ